MNQRIEKLAMQANNHHGNIFDLNHKELNVFLEKFAELIVRECISALDSDDGATHHNELLLKHFGVE